MADSRFPTLVIGAGPAGLSAAYELARHGERCVVVEQDNIVGGLARTSEYKGYLFDVGGHRFFTKVAVVQKMWQEVLGADLIARPRLSRIYYKSKYFHYPIEPVNALMGLGPVEAAYCALSYLKAKVLPHPEPDHLEGWMTNQFGARLYEIFFKTYTEKVWGMPCRQIQADWAKQRIRGLSLSSLLKDALTPRTGRNPKNGLKTLIQEFDYPRRGPGMMWTRTREIVEAKGCPVEMQSPVQKIHWTPGRVTGVQAGGRRWEAGQFISSMPIRELIERLDPPPPDWVLKAAADFNYRDFLTVALVVRGQGLFPDNWIYVHDPSVKVGRIQNYNNWSPEMVPDPANTCLGLEYFCFEGDELWRTPDLQLIDLARQEAAKLGLLRKEKVIDGVVLRVPKAYPVYDGRYEAGLDKVRRFLTEIPNIQLVGRNGMHRYNNQDHSMLTGILAARNILGQGRFDLWKVNADTDYHEDGFRLSEEEIVGLEQTQPMPPHQK